MHLTKHPLQDSSGVTFTVVIRGDPALASDTGSPQHKGQHGGREGVGGRKGQCYYQVINMRPLLSYRHLE